MKCRICFLRPQGRQLPRTLHVLTFLGAGRELKCNFLPSLLDEEVRGRQGITTQREREFPVIKHFVQSNAFIHCVSISLAGPEGVRDPRKVRVVGTKSEQLPLSLKSVRRSRSFHRFY